MNILKLGSIIALIVAGLSISSPQIAQAQTSSCRATSSAPSYSANTVNPLSCDLSGNLRAGGGGGGGGDVNLTEIGGNAVTVTTPGVLDVTCVSGCVAGSGTAQGVATAAAPSYIEGTDNPLSLDLSGNLRVSIGNATLAVTQSGAWNIGTVTAVTAITNALPAGNNNIGDVDAIQSGTWTVQPGNTANTTPWLTTPVAPTTQADTLSFSVILANSTNATSVKASPGTLFEISTYAISATEVWLKLYDTASAPTCGSGTPVGRYLIPGSDDGAGSNVSIPVGKEFTSGIGFCVTTGIADTDTGAVAASTYTVNLTYK